jgi:hypothetical protein
MPQKLFPPTRPQRRRRFFASALALLLVGVAATAVYAKRGEAAVDKRQSKGDAKRKKKPLSTDDKKKQPAPPAVDASGRPGNRGPASPQDATPPNQIVVRSASKFDVSPPLSTMTPNLLEADEGEGKGQDDRGPGGPVGNTAHTPDPVLQGTVKGVGGEAAAPGVPGRLGTPEGEATGAEAPLLEIAAPDRSFAGMFNPPGPTGPVPPDPVGDIGPNHYIQMVNSRFQIFTRGGTSVFGPANINTLFSGFGGPCQTENAGDPVVVYDELADRWVLMQFTSAGPTYFLCTAVSTTGDPTGSYYRYAISTGANFPDYPKMGVWPDAYYFSTREFLNGAAFAGVGAYALDRQKAVRGDPTALVISTLIAPLPAPLPNPIPPTGPQPMYRIGDGLLPSDLDGYRLPPAGQPNFFVGSMDNGGGYGAPQDALNVFEFHVDFAVPANSTFTFKGEVPIAAYDTIFPCSGGATPSRNCIPQPGTTVRIDILSYRQRPLHRLAYRNFGTHESLVTNQAVEAAPGIAGTRWWELRSPHTTPTIFQEGTYAPGVTDSIHRWMGSASMDHEGNIGLAYSVSAAATVFPGIRYTGRLVTDPPGTLPQGEGILATGGGSQTSTSSRWGDYSSMNVDPNNDCDLWITNEYYETTSARGWSTRIGSFRFPQCHQLPSVSVVASGQLVISEFRLRGPSGSMDEFVELYNPADTALTVKSVDGTGHAVVSSDAPTLAKCVVPEGTVVPARGHFLCANTASPGPGADPAYSLMNYPAGDGTTATPDNNILSDIPDNSGLALFRTTTAVNFTLANRLDAVGFVGVDPLFFEGTALPTAVAIDNNHSFVRRLPGGCTGGVAGAKCGSSTLDFSTPAARNVSLSLLQNTPGPPSSYPQDSNNNANDFLQPGTNGLPVLPPPYFRLGAPGPENMTSPVANDTRQISSPYPFCVGASAAPNRVRNTTPGPTTTSSYGTLEIRKSFINNTPNPITRLRFRLTDMTTFPAYPATTDVDVPGVAACNGSTCVADLRAVDSSDTTDGTPAQCGPKLLRGTTVETSAPGQQQYGGGWNSSMVANLSTPLNPGDAVHVRFVLGVQQNGKFRFFFTVEALPFQ